MSLPPTILIVDDDSEIRELLRQHLSRNGFRATVAATAKDMDQALASTRVDAIVLDIMMPGEDGLSACDRLAGRKAPPILLLSAKGSEADRIKGLEVGADDYLPKPFNPRELVLRLQAILRRRSTGLPEVLDGAERVLSFSGFELHVEARQLLDPNGEEVSLRTREFDLLRLLAERPNEVVSREDLMELTGARALAAFERSIDVQLSRIRAKLGDDPKAPHFIRTVRNQGYVFTQAVRETTICPSPEA